MNIKVIGLPTSDEIARVAKTFLKDWALNKNSFPTLKFICEKSPKQSLSDEEWTRLRSKAQKLSREIFERDLWIVALTRIEMRSDRTIEFSGKVSLTGDISEFPCIFVSISCDYASGVNSIYELNLLT